MWCLLDSTGLTHRHPVLLTLNTQSQLYIVQALCFHLGSNDLVYSLPLLMARHSKIQLDKCCLLLNQLDSNHPYCTYLCLRELCRKSLQDIERLQMFPLDNTDQNCKLPAWKGFHKYSQGRTKQVL